MVKKCAWYLPYAFSSLRVFHMVKSLDINDIIEAIRASRVRISDHADEEAEADQLSFDEIYFSVLHGEIIEDYPSDKPYPSCLIFGETFSDDPVHSV